MNNLSGKKLLVLGATGFICELVRDAQARGAYVIAVDYYEDSPAKRIADESLLMDATDVEGLTKYVVENGIDGVLTGFIDSVLPAYVELCQRTSLPCYLNRRQLRFTLDKELFKAQCRQFDIPTVREYGMGDRVEFPVLVKPTDNSGARGISVCRNDRELKVGIAEALRYSKAKKVLVEDYIDSQEATAFYVFVDGRIHLAAFADRHVAPVREGLIRLPTGYSFPSRSLAAFLADSHPKFCRLFEALGVTNGCMFIQGFVVPERGFVPYEPGFRLTASFENHVLQRSCGYSNMGMLVNFALTGRMCSRELEGRISADITPSAYNISFLIRPGRITRVEGVAELLQSPHVVHLHQSYRAGDVLPPEAWGRLSQVFLRVIVSGGKPGYDEVVRISRECLKVTDDQGADMLINREIVEGCAI